MEKSAPNGIRRSPWSLFDSLARFTGVAEDRYSTLSCVAIALVLFAVPLFFALGRSDLENDEAIYTHAARSIIEEGAWLSPWASPGRHAFLEKPPLKFWIVAGGIEWLGLPNDPLGYRFWDALFGACALLYLIALGRTAGGPICGLAAAAALFLNESLLFNHGIRSNNMEAALLLAYCGGIWHWVRWMTSERKSRPRRAHLAAFSLWVAFAFLCKFVAALFLPLCAVSTLLFPQIRRRLWEDRRAVGFSLALFLVLVSPWFVYQHVQRGAFFWKVILGEHIVQRFSTYLDPSHVQPAGFYWQALRSELQGAGTWWWTCAGAVLWLAITLRQRSAFGYLVMIWAVLPLALLSAGSSKLFHYAYPFLPAYALLAGFAFSRTTQVVCAGLFGAGRSLLRKGRAFRGARGPGFLRMRRLMILPALLALSYSTYVQSRILSTDPKETCSHRARRASLGAAALLSPAPGIGPPLAVGAAILWVFSRPPSTWCSLVRRTGRGPTVRRVLADCVSQLEGDGEVPKIFLHSFRSFGPSHTDHYYYSQAGGYQQLHRPQPSLLFFRLWVQGQRALSVVHEDLWTQFLELRSRPELRHEIESVASRIGMEAEVAAVIHQLESIDVPAGVRILPYQRIYLPEPFEACLQPVMDAGALPLEVQSSAATRSSV